MSKRQKVPNRVQEIVRKRAKYLCEYCHTNETWQYVLFTIEHIRPISKSGSNDLDNLCLACFHCNRRKSNLQTAVDPQTNEPVPIFNPRNQDWADHFTWSQDKLSITGLTPTGRATISLLELNRERVKRIREDDLLVNRHPPKNDPILESN